MSCAILTNDLVFGSRVGDVTKKLGTSFAWCDSVDLLWNRCQAVPTKLVLVDLSFPGLNIASAMADLGALPNPPRAVVAYAPHVHEERLAAATEAGCTEVLSRGQFNSQMERILKQYLADEASP